MVKLIFILLVLISSLSFGEELEDTPFIPMERNGVPGFWMNLETAKDVLWAMDMIPVYEANLDEMGEHALEVHDTLDKVLDENEAKDRKIESLERWRIGQLVANFVLGALAAGGILVW